MSQGRTFSFDDTHDLNDQQQPYHDYTSRSAVQRPSVPQHAPHLDPVTSTIVNRPVSAHSRSQSRHEPSFDVARWPSTRNDDGSDVSGTPPPPLPPPHRSPTRSSVMYPSGVTTNFDHFGDQAHGISSERVARDVADGTPRESGQEAMRGLPHSAQRDRHPRDRSSSSHNNNPYNSRPPTSHIDRNSYSSNIPLYGGAATPGSLTPRAFTNDTRSSRHSMLSLVHDGYPQYPLNSMDQYHDSPYQNSQHHSAAVSHADINPYNIADDGDDGFMPEPKRRSMLPLSRPRSRDELGAGIGSATAGNTAGVGGRTVSRRHKNGMGTAVYDAVDTQPNSEEKSEWLSRQTKGKNKMRWIVGTIIAAVVVLAIIAGIVGAVLGTRNSGGTSGSSNNSNTASGDTAANGDLDLNSAEIKQLMNNKNLHKVFPGIDYTPWGTQYPLCMTYPPSQNNVTRDMAVLSQLTNAVRLYGTDCNQIEMVLHSIDRLQLKNMKVWLGVWIDTNTTTTERQLEQMYKILANTKDHSIFKGTIIGNEALYRAGEDKAQSEAELIQILKDVRSNFTSLGYDLTISTSDLGDNWNGQLVAATDYVMSNIHPFFAGVDIANAASWTYNFWQTHDVVLTQNTNVKQLISETGWPSGGGTDCGNTANVCAAGQTGAVASVANMNQFMNEWVCQALDNGTNYFWFEAFDEPWKVAYNEPGKAWEDKWGLMDPARNLKPGLVIPSCGGKTVS